ncbi:MAG: hypothetical protein IT308_04890 [Anaerolineaceae bacterium]|nr:hypothetical protein [Anaerolineaceae bacterium]
MILSFLGWYLLISLVGAVALPLTLHVFSGLTDRGYALTRIFGLLLWGYVFWLLASLRVLQNDRGGILLALGLIALASVLFVRRSGLRDILHWLQQAKTQILTVEILFFMAFAGWAVVRAADPAALGTEKPMELAFINAILRSPLFPPHDPWLSGYAISYYYFGYVMAAMLAKMTAVSGAVAFNLASALWFALTATGAYGILFNLLCKIRGGEPGGGRPISRLAASFWGLFAPLFVLIVSNLEGFLEVLHARGFFWKSSADGTLISPFWQWLDIQELVRPPTPPFGFIPERSSGIWWWRASRVLQDYDLAGQGREIIDEFPFFSYLLGDLHPHVLAMPFVLLVIGLALNTYLRGLGESPIVAKGFFHATRDWLNGRPFEWTAVGVGGILRKWEIWLTGLVLGSLAFLNTWDFPIYVGLFCVVLVFLRYQKEGWSMRRAGELVELAAIFAVMGVILYLPFYLGFSSQVGGVIPSLAFFTRGVHFWVMFGPLLLPVVLWLAWLGVRHRHKIHGRSGLVFAAGTLFGLWLVSYLLGWLALSMPVWGNMLLMGNPGPLLQKLGQAMLLIGGQFYGVQGSADAGWIITASLEKRLLNSGTWLTLLVLLAAIWCFLGLFRARLTEDSVIKEDVRSNNPDAFVLLIFLVGVGLVLVPEFLYLRDQFGWRMNTIFKFYFQTWILWALVAAYASVTLWVRLKSFWRMGFAVVWSVILLAGLVYPFFGLRMKGMAMAGELTLDSAAYLERYSPEEMEAIRFLQGAPPGVVVEAVGGSYSSFGRVSMLSGDPAVLGWPGHESQWRGGAAEMGSREEDVRTLYRTSDWDEAKTILERYNIRYIYIGSQEHSAYRVNEVKFVGFLQPVFKNNGVVIYENPSALPLEE